jgi:hypothetical protein
MHLKPLSELISNCLNIEISTKYLVLRGTADLDTLMNNAHKMYAPENEMEEEIYEDAVMYSRLSILN